MRLKSSMTAATTWSKVILLALTACAAAGCSNETDENQPNNPYAYQGEPIPIEASVGSIEAYGTAPVTRSGQTSESFCEPLDDDYNMVTTIESVAPDSTTTAPVTRGALGDGIRFKVVAYRNNAVSKANYAGAGEYHIKGPDGVAAQVDPANPFKLMRGTYKFVCYSYNATTPINDGFNGATATKLDVDQGTDFSSCSLDNVEVKAKKGIFTLPTINFARQCSKLYIEAKSISGNITACNATLTNVNANSVKWTLGTTDLPNTATGGILPQFTWTTPNAETVNSDAQYLLPNDGRNVTLTMNMTVKDKVYTGKTFTIASRSFLKGTSYKITANIKKNYIEVPGISFKIATGNVLATPLPDTSPVQYKYQFQATQGNYSYVWDGGDYFNWGCVDPTNYQIDISDNNAYEDVCQKIGSQWRTPNKDEMMQFENCGTKGVGSYDGATKGTVTTTVKGYYFGVNPGGIDNVPTDKDKYVFLPLAGWRDGGSQDIVPYISGSYWSRTPDENYACSLDVSSYDVYVSNGSLRDNGHPVRCITGG